MQWQPEQKTTLKRHLNAVQPAARQMLAVLLEEYDSLYQREAPSPELLTRKADAAQALETLYAEFRQFRDTLPTDDLPATLKADGESELLSRWLAAEATLQQCDYHNEVNGRLLNRLHVKNRLFSRVMNNQTDPIYSRHGQLDESRRGVLGSA